MIGDNMKIEQLLQSKSKEEIAFLLYTGKNTVYKINCLECPFFIKDKHNVWKCFSLIEDACREEYYKWLESEK